MKGKCLDRFDYFTESRDFSDKHGHGTSVLGVILGETMGIAPRADYYILKVRDDKNKSMPVRYVERALVDWMDADVDIINISIGYEKHNPDLEKICRLVHRRNKLIVSAAGKTLIGPAYPASCDGVISVATVDGSGKHRKTSNIWPSVDISAPGEKIFTAGLNKKNEYGLAYTTCDGTSMAAPHVTGTMALAVAYLKSRKIEYDVGRLELLMKASAAPPEYDIKKIKETLEKHRSNLGSDMHPAQFVRCMYGSGIIRADDFLKEVMAHFKNA